MESACNPSQNANGITFNGSALRARSAGSDFCLVQLNQVPSGNSGITYSGWSRNTVGIQNTTIIHHPAGDVMKISRDEQPPVFATFLGSQSWQLVLDQGATNGGSSGGPYYDQNHRIIAQHHGINQNNADQCLNTNKFGGRFNVSWDGDGTNATRLSNWLDPSNSGAMTTDSRRIPFVTGPTLICTNGTFSLQNQPAGSTINWTSSNPNILTIDPNTGVANRQNSNSGSIVITASVQMPGGCNPALYTLSIWVGNPGASITTLIYPSGLRGVNPVSLGPASIYQFRCDPVGGFPTSWTWVLPSGFSFYSGSTTSTPYIMTSSTNGSYTMYCQVNNTCGSSWTNSLGINISSSGGGTPLRVRGDSQQTDSGEINIEETQINSSVPYPNPASETLNIELEGTSTLTILSIAGQKILSTTGTGKITIPITELSNGIYFLTISNVKGTARHKFIIQH
ncbi:MAG: T9SS type A sorting domain-containing protein [Melioribacteraceae bacterium]|nr:T9SS type A sorting domain-containing protein [Melioribacteraceae bacterium]